MSLYICKNLSTKLRSITTFPQVKNLWHLSYRHFTSSAIDNHTNQESFTVSYLINSCGLSSKNALSASKRVKFNSPENADSVIALFKKHGFTDTHISNIVRKFPVILSSDCESTILPKLEYFKSIGFSNTDLREFVVASPRILRRSLVKSIIPACTFLRNLLKTNARTIIATRRFLSMGYFCDIEACVMHNIKILGEFGVNEPTMLNLLATYPTAFNTATDRFKITVEKVKQLGFNPRQVKFVLALHVLLSISKSTWETKVKILKKWGWSEEDVYVAFGKYPFFMAVSVDKMSSVMDMVINKSGFDPSDVVHRPHCFAFSLEKRVVPRCLLYQDLLKRGLIRKKWRLRVLLGYSDTQFMKMITMCYRESAPELLKLYQEKLEKFKVTSRGIKLCE